MRVGMGLIKNEHGVWQVRKKVPKRLEAARATVLGAAARLWLRIGEQRARHEGTAGLPRAPQHPA